MKIEPWYKVIESHMEDWVKVIDKAEFIELTYIPEDMNTIHKELLALFIQETKDRYGMESISLTDELAENYDYLWYTEEWKGKNNFEVCYYGYKKQIIAVVKKMYYDEFDGMKICEWKEIISYETIENIYYLFD